MTDLLSGLCPVHLQELRTFDGMEESEFLRMAEGCVCESPSVLLLSGGDLREGDENRYSILAHDPFLILRGKRDAVGIVTARGVQEWSADPIGVFEELFEKIRPGFEADIPPFCGGAAGYLSYDLKNCMENLPATARKDPALPDLYLLWPGRIDVYDRKLRRCSRAVLDPTRIPKAAAGLDRDLFEVGPLTSNFSHEDYLAALGKVRDYIRRGDAYQVNLSQRFQFPFRGDPFRLFTSLFDRNPASFYAYVNAGDHRIVSTSMERFLLRKGEYIESRPIKGTRRRGATEQEDGELKAELLNCPKDDAELSMIVDLIRNDLGRICRAGTVRVAEHKRLETYENVHHLVSIVTGALRPGTKPGDILRATFPGGSITGCPKIRAMEIIDELEPDARHAYTGATGYIGWHDNLDLNVAIRTAIVKDNTCYFSVGGGVVYDSNEEEEYRETLDKGRTLFDLIENIRGKS